MTQKKISKSKAITTVKVFNPDWTCRGFQFEVGKTYQHKGTVKACSSGFHSCVQPNHCFDYYDFDTKNKVAECRVWGAIDTHDSDSKVASEYIEIIRELSWQEVLVLVNNGKNNTGRGNSGDRNSGDRNSGNRNSGDRNSGNRNSGDRNSGDQNSGYWNSGYWNSGNRNSGDQNSGYRNSGAFCTADNPELWLFDKPSGMTVREWEESDAVRLMTYSLETEIWVYASEMSEQEKANNPHWETTDGYLKSVPLKEAWKNAWHNFNDASKLVFLTLPNFDLEKFQIITGLDVKDDFERLV